MRDSHASQRIPEVPDLDFLTKYYSIWIDFVWNYLFENDPLSYEIIQ
ncbi:hypothetical protein QFZ99_005086 [Paraburkholderia atlantica]|uniref:Uncharacterized protein n=1 Tax=Paraburkholderia atlantica TaxID=2654982 RepID=A0A7W8Q3N4_PARAM|nr:hypothetical protein [Paraburkholderia atlantica]